MNKFLKPELWSALILKKYKEYSEPNTEKSGYSLVVSKKQFEALKKSKIWKLI